MYSTSFHIMGQQADVAFSQVHNWHWTRPVQQVPGLFLSRVWSDRMLETQRCGAVELGWGGQGGGGRLSLSALGLGPKHTSSSTFNENMCFLLGSLLHCDWMIKLKVNRSRLGPGILKHCRCHLDGACGCWQTVYRGGGEGIKHYFHWHNLKLNRKLYIKNKVMSNHKLFFYPNLAQREHKHEYKVLICRCWCVRFNLGLWKRVQLNEKNAPGDNRRERKMWHLWGKENRGGPTWPPTSHKSLTIYGWTRNCPTEKTHVWLMHSTCCSGNLNIPEKTKRKR